MGLAAAKTQEFIWDLLKLGVIEVMFRYTGTYVKLGEAAVGVIACLIAYKHREHLGFGRKRAGENHTNYGRRSTDHSDLRGGSRPHDQEA